MSQVAVSFSSDFPKSCGKIASRHFKELLRFQQEKLKGEKMKERRVKAF